VSHPYRCISCTNQCTCRVNSYFSNLVEERLFGIIAVGTYFSPKFIPPRILRHVRFVTVHGDMFDQGSKVWSQLCSVELRGLRCVNTCYAPSFWSSLASSLCLVQLPIYQLALRLYQFQYWDTDMDSLEEAMKKLSQTVCVASFDLVGCTELSRNAMCFVQKYFTGLVSVEFINLDRLSSRWVLSFEWACASYLRCLRFDRCRMVFSSVKCFIAYTSRVVDLVMEDCVPEDAAEMVGFLGIERDREFECLRIPSSYRDGMDYGSICIYRY
jgi:hypothetical protein